MMPHKKSNASRTFVAPITPEEAERQASLIVEKLLDKKNPLTRRAILEGLKRPGTLDYLAKELGIPTSRSDPSFLVKLRSALEKGNRQRLISLFAQDLLKNPIPPGKDSEVIQALGPQAFRKVLLEVAEELKGRPGKPPLVDPSDYPLLANLANSLRPVVMKILEEREARNPRTINECLEFWRKQFPEPCLFLLRNEDKLAELLNAKRLPKLATKLGTQARVIADSLAGCEKGLTFATSIERVREGRRMSTMTPAENSAN